MVNRRKVLIMEQVTDTGRLNETELGWTDNDIV